MVVQITSAASERIGGPASGSICCCTAIQWITCVHQAVKIEREAKRDQTNHDVVCVQGREGRESILGRYQDPRSIGRVG